MLLKKITQLKVGVTSTDSVAVVLRHSPATYRHHQQGGKSHNITMLSTAFNTTRRQTARAFSSGPVLPRITERRPNETGRGGRASDAGVKVCVFGATGFLGRYVTSGLGESDFQMSYVCLLVYCGGVWGGHRHLMVGGREL